MANPRHAVEGQVFRRLKIRKNPSVFEISREMAEPNTPSNGIVYLVGAGPGDPGMLTLRGKECVQQADVIIHDYLVNPRILSFSNATESICLGKHGTGRIYSQDEVNEMIVRYASEGKKVVRLKGGDPAIFARVHEELEYIRERGIPFEIVPGITAALAVTGTVGISLTHRDYSSAVALITGQGKNGGPPQNIDYQALAHFPGTLVFYMGTTTVSHWSTELIQAGMDPETPVVATRHCSLPYQESFQCRLGEISARVNHETKLRPPVLFVVGQAAKEFGRYDWFESRPLFGKTILVTRPQHQAAELAHPLEALGAEVLLQPAITITPTRDQKSFDETLSELGTYDWIVFSSANGVEHFMSKLLESHDIRALSAARVAAIGPATARKLAQFHIKADLVPKTFDADTLADELRAEVQGSNVLLIRASRGREVLQRELLAGGAQVKQLVCYESEDVTLPDESIQKRISNGEIDYVTVSSSAIAHATHQLFGDELSKTRLISISPITSQALKELGLKPAVEANQYTMDGMIAALLKSIST